MTAGHPGSQRPSSSGKELPVGTRIEEFVIERVLGSGGFGITYLARDIHLNRQVVIKENLPSQFALRDTTSLTIHPGPSREDAENFRWSLENFSKESAMLASLDHPGIVKVLRSFRAFGTAYFVMPFVAGETFDHLIDAHKAKNRSFDEAELRGLLQHALAALDYLHDRGIYHRDIKPGNILITHEGLPVLIDFGSARQRLSERSMTVVESPGYTPFEQLQSRGNVGPWSDLYALGGTLAKALTGAAPPKANDRIRKDPHVPLANRPELARTYSAAFLGGIDKALAVEEEDRWQNAGEWLAALRGKNTVKPPPVPAMAQGPQTPRTQRLDPSILGKKNKPLPWIIAACVILGLGLGVWAMISSNDKQKAPVVTVVDDAAVQRERDKAAATARVKAAEERALQAEREKQALTAQVKAQEDEAKAAQQRLADLAAAKVIKATKDQPYVNSLGMKFVPVEITGGPISGQKVLFSIWETRVGDYVSFVEASKGSYRYEDGGTPYVWDGGKWEQKSGASWKNPGFSQTDAHPVTCVSWEDAGKFCAWLTEKERASGKIEKLDTYRLPTDHEWSCAVGIGDREDASKTPKEKSMKIADVYPWNGGRGTWPLPKGAGNYCGQEMKGQVGGMIDGYEDGYMTTAPVGSFGENGKGLYDLGGNVWEWCESSYDGSSDSGTPRVLRGGSWLSVVRVSLLSSCRGFYVPGRRYGSRGFRCVLVVSSTALEDGTQSPSVKAPANPPAARMPKAVDLSGFALISGGEFTMGDAVDGDSKYLPQHKVNVSAFYMQRKEVSKAEWDEVRAWGVKNGYTDLPEGKGKAADHPVHAVSWHEVVKWCNARSQKEGLTPCYYTDVAHTVLYQTGQSDFASTMVKWSAKGYRLPTEAEWEKAARGGLSGKRFPWGDTISHEQANFNNYYSYKSSYQKGSSGCHPTYKTGESPYTSPVGSFAANGYGLYDMAGNVHEWCWDRYGSYPTDLETDPVAPVALHGSGRVFRGGDWINGADKCCVADRNFSSSSPGSSIGFRPVRR